jgi:hypothetical protein
MSLVEHPETIPSEEKAYSGELCPNEATIQLDSTEPVPIAHPETRTLGIEAVQRRRPPGGDLFTRSYEVRIYSSIDKLYPLKRSPTTSTFTPEEATIQTDLTKPSHEAILQSPPLLAHREAVSSEEKPYNSELYP